MKMRLTIILVVELLLSFWIFSFAIMDDWRLAEAIVAFHKNPSTETRTALNRQRTSSNWQGLAVFAVIFSALVVPTIPLVVMLERRKSKNLP